MKLWFKPKSPFSPDDLCWLQLSGSSRFYHLSGRECTVLSSLFKRKFSDGRHEWCHEIEILDVVNRWFATPDVLRKQPPPETRITNWDECPFKPKEVEPVWVGVDLASGPDISVETSACQG